MVRATERLTCRLEHKRGRCVIWEALPKIDRTGFIGQLSHRRERIDPKTRDAGGCGFHGLRISSSEDSPTPFERQLLEFRIGRNHNRISGHLEHCSIGQRVTEGRLEIRDAVRF